MFSILFVIVILVLAALLIAGNRLRRKAGYSSLDVAIGDKVDAALRRDATREQLDYEVQQHNFRIQDRWSER